MRMLTPAPRRPSKGIYVFKKQALVDLLDSGKTSSKFMDFGGEIIPYAAQNGLRVQVGRSGGGRVRHAGGARAGGEAIPYGAQNEPLRRWAPLRSENGFTCCLSHYRSRDSPHTPLCAPAPPLSPTLASCITITPPPPGLRL